MTCRGAALTDDLGCTAAPRCHTPDMTRYVISVKRKLFCVERIDRDGSRVVVQQYAAESDAVSRRKALQEEADEIEDRSLKAPPKGPR